MALEFCSKVNITSDSVNQRWTDSASPGLTFGLQSEVGGQAYDFGSNYVQLGCRNTAYAGGFIRVDLRDAYICEFFSLRYIPAGGSVTPVFKISRTGSVVSYGSISGATCIMSPKFLEGGTCLASKYLAAGATATCATTAGNALSLGGSLANTYAKLASPAFTGSVTVTGITNHGFIATVPNSYYSLISSNACNNKQWGIYHSDTCWIVREAGVADVLTFKPGGNVGIGTTAPNYPLDVWKTSGGTEILALNLRNNDSASNGTGVGIGFTAYGDDVVTGSISNVRTSAGQYALIFKNWNSNLEEHMRITANGNTGIGTNEPLAKLDITRPNDSGSILRLGNSSTTGFNFSRDLDDGHLSIQGEQEGFNNIVLAPTSGNVGVNTVSPDSALHINASTLGSTGFTGAGSAVHIKQNTAWSGAQPWALFVEGYSWLNGFRINAADTTRSLYKTDNGPIGFATSSDDAIIFTQSTDVERMRINAGGNVGIGTPTPSQILHVRTGTPVINIQTCGAGTGVSPVSRKIMWSNYLDGEAGSINLFDYNFDTTRTEMAFTVKNNSDTLQEAMRIRYDGNVGIGTTAPDNPLHIVCNENIGTADQWRYPLKLELNDTLNGIWQGSGVGMKFHLKASDINADIAEIVAKSNSTGGQGHLIFRTGTNGTLANNMIITETGSVQLKSVAAKGVGDKVVYIKSDGTIVSGTTAGGSSQWSDITGGIAYGGGKVSVSGVGNSLVFDTTGAIETSSIGTTNGLYLTLANGRGYAPKIDMTNDVGIKFTYNCVNVLTVGGSSGAVNVGIGAATSSTTKLTVTAGDMNGILVTNNSADNASLVVRNSAGAGAWGIYADSGNKHHIAGKLGLGSLGCPEVILDVYGTSPTNWKGSGAFRGATNAVIMGELSGIANIGGHNSALSAWATLGINAGGGKVSIGTASPSTNANFTVLGGTLLSNVGEGNADSWFPYSNGNVYITSHSCNACGDIVFRKNTANSAYTTLATMTKEGNLSVAGCYIGNGSALSRVSVVGNYLDSAGQADAHRNGSIFAYATAGTPFNGPLFTTGGFNVGSYPLQINAAYIGSNSIAWRTKSDDGGGTWGSWKEFVHAGNIAAQTVKDSACLGGVPASSYWSNNGSWLADLGSYGYTRYMGNEYVGGAIALLTCATAGGQTTVLIDGNFIAGEANGFYSLGTLNCYSTRVGFKHDGCGGSLFDGNITLKASSFSWGEGLNIDSPSNVWGGVKFRTIGRTGDAGNWHIGYNGTHSDTSNSHLYLYQGSTVYSQTWYYGNGNTLVSGCGTAVDWIATSDCRLKKDIEPITDALSVVKKLQGVSYTLCYDENNEKHIGFVAQDVEKVLPVVVSHGEPSESDKEHGITDSRLGIKYDKLTAILLEAIKEQQVQIDTLKQEIININNNLNLK